MKPFSEFKFVRRMLAASAVALFGGILFACGGGGSSVAAGGGTGSTTVTQAQFDALLKTSTLYTTLTAQLATDEATIARMAAFGHAPGHSTVDGRSPMSVGAHPGVTTAAITFGPCPDMGEHVGDSQPDPAAAPVSYFKECLINGAQYIYGAVNGTGAIKAADKIWFTDTSCGAGGGSPIEIDDGEMYNSLALRQGIVFASPVDGSEVMVTAGQGGSTVTAHSDYSGVCTTEDTTAPGYAVTPNDVNVTGVPAAVPSDFIY